MENIQFMIVDDHPTFREGLANILEAEGGFKCVAKAADGAEGVRFAKKLKPNVALIDVSMPNLSGIQAAKEINKACPETTIIMLSAFDYESYVLASLQAGAKGYILKTSPLERLVTAIRLVHSGGSVLDLQASDRLVHHLNVVAASGGRAPKDFELLHARELEVLKLTARGLSNKEIGNALNISERTVQTHLVKVFKKLGVNSRTQAVLHALREGWIILPDAVKPNSQGNASI